MREGQRREKVRKEGEKKGRKDGRKDGRKGGGSKDTHVNISSQLASV